MRVNAKSFQACNCLTVRQAARHVTQFYHRFLALSGLRTTQFSILARLQEQGPMTINALAVNLVLERTTLGRNILPLERDGLIRIGRAARCRRCGRQSGGKRTLRARERAAVPPRHRGRARERAEDPTIIPAIPAPACFAPGAVASILRG